MQPLGNKVLIKLIHEEKVSASGLILDTVKNPFNKVEVVGISPDSDVLCYKEDWEITRIDIGDICLAEDGGVEVEPDIWLCRSDVLVAKL